MHTLHICTELRYAQQISLAAASAGVLECEMWIVHSCVVTAEQETEANQRLGNFGPAGRDIFKS